MEVMRKCLDKQNLNSFTPEKVKEFKHIVFLHNDNKFGDLIISQIAYREFKKLFPQVKIIAYYKSKVEEMVLLAKKAEQDGIVL